MAKTHHICVCRGKDKVMFMGRQDDVRKEGKAWNPMMCKRFVLNMLLPEQKGERFKMGRCNDDLPIAKV